MKKLLMAVLMMTVVQVSHGEIMIYGEGLLSCGTWIEHREEESWGAVINGSWVRGYVVAVQDQSFITLKKTDVPAMSAFVDKYCRENPLDSVLDASRALVDALRQ